MLVNLSDISYTGLQLPFFSHTIGLAVIECQRQEALNYCELP